MNIEVLNHMIKPGRTFKKWLKRVQDDKTPWTENEIIYFRKFIRGGEHGRYLLSLFKQEYSITQEQTIKGIEYLRNTVFKKNGKFRNTKNMPFGEREIDIIKDFKEFKFVALYPIGYAAYYLPVYRVIDNQGNSFEYTTDMGRMEVTG